MDKQKQIEEMVITAYPIYATMEDKLRKQIIENLNSYVIFERLYNAGYRKIPEGADWLDGYKQGFKEGVEAVRLQFDEGFAHYGSRYNIEKRVLLDWVYRICNELTEGSNESKKS